MHPNPRFSQEVFDLFIDALAEQRNVEWYLLNLDYFAMDRSRKRFEEDIGRCLRSCALVCKSWYTRSVRHLWSHLRIRTEWNNNRMPNLWNALIARPTLRQRIKHLNIHLCNEERGSKHLFLALCSFLPLVPSLRIQASEGYSGTSYEWSTYHGISRVTKRLYSSSILTTFFYQGERFPIDILNSMPHLRDISLTGDYKRLVLEYPSPSSSFTQSGKKIPIRLRRAHFYNAEEVLVVLVDGAPQMFSEVEEFNLARRLSPPAIDYPVTCSQHVNLLSLAKGSLRRVRQEVGSPFQYIEAMRRLNFNLVELHKLTHLTLHGSGRHFNILGSWQNLSLFLANPKSMSPSLTFLEILITGISLYDLGRLADPGHVGWSLAKHYLAPQCLPALKEFGIRGYWGYGGLANVPHRRDVPASADDQVSKGFETMFRRSYPTWSGDTRGLNMWCKFEADYKDSEWW